jgi:hypothetical protein
MNDTTITLVTNKDEVEWLYWLLVEYAEGFEDDDDTGGAAEVDKFYAKFRDAYLGATEVLP